MEEDDSLENNNNNSFSSNNNNNNGQKNKKKYVKMVIKLQYIMAQLAVANISHINPYDLTLMFYNDCGKK